jgi:hypothetical protein
MNRRGFLQGILASGVAPFIVKAESLMAIRVPFKGFILDEYPDFDSAHAYSNGVLTSEVFETGSRKFQLVQASLLRQMETEIPPEFRSKVEWATKQAFLGSADPLNQMTGAVVWRYQGVLA